MRYAKTKHDFKSKIFQKWAIIIFENKEFPNIQIILGNYKFAILERILLKFKEFFKIGLQVTRLRAERIYLPINVVPVTDLVCGLKNRNKNIAENLKSTWKVKNKHNIS